MTFTMDGTLISFRFLLSSSSAVNWQPSTARMAVVILSRLAWLSEDLPADLDLVDALLQPSMPDAKDELPATSGWQMAWLAGEALAYLGQSFDLGSASREVDRVKERLSALLALGMLDPHERAAAGRALDRLPRGDSRLGVSGSGSLWCKVPACPFWMG